MEKNELRNAIIRTPMLFRVKKRCRADVDCEFPEPFRNKVTRQTTFITPFVKWFPEPLATGVLLLLPYRVTERCIGNVRIEASYQKTFRFKNILLVSSQKSAQIDVC